MAKRDPDNSVLEYQQSLEASSDAYAVVDLTSGSVIGKDANKAVPLASVTKLFTAAAILHAHGPNWLHEGTAKEQKRKQTLMKEFLCHSKNANGPILAKLAFGDGPEIEAAFAKMATDLKLQNYNPKFRSGIFDATTGFNSDGNGPMASPNDVAKVLKSLYDVDDGKFMREYASPKSGIGHTMQAYAFTHEGADIIGAKSGTNPKAGDVTAAVLFRNTSNDHIFAAFAHTDSKADRRNAVDMLESIGVNFNGVHKLGEKLGLVDPKPGPKRTVDLKPRPDTMIERVKELTEQLIAKGKIPFPDANALPQDKRDEIIHGLPPSDQSTTDPVKMEQLKPAVREKMVMTRERMLERHRMPKLPAAKPALDAKPVEKQDATPDAEKDEHKTAPESTKKHDAKKNAVKKDEHKKQKKLLKKQHHKHHKKNKTQDNADKPKPADKPVSDYFRTTSKEEQERVAREANYILRGEKGFADKDGFDRDRKREFQQALQDAVQPKEKLAIDGKIGNKTVEAARDYLKEYKRAQETPAASNDAAKPAVDPVVVKKDAVPAADNKLAQTKPAVAPISHA